MKVLVNKFHYIEEEKLFFKAAFVMMIRIVCEIMIFS